MTNFFYNSFSIFLSAAQIAPLSIDLYFKDDFAFAFHIQQKKSQDMVACAWSSMQSGHIEITFD